MTADDPQTLDRTYATARRRFLGAAERAGAAVTTFPHPASGLEGEELAIDVAQHGDDAAPSVLVIVSATHGVEGYAGSALQSWWLDERSASATSDRARIVMIHGLNPDGSAWVHGVEGYAGSALQSWWLDERSASATSDRARIVMIHGFNPVGFSWVRRVNEDNVDLNRNFVDWATAPRNDAYAEIADVLVPPTWTDETLASTTAALMDVAGDVGLERFQQIVSGGQYDHPTGIFYGGRGPVWSNRWLAEHLARFVGPATRLGVIDLHTGLGEWGHGELISHEQVGGPGYVRGTNWWGDVRSMLGGESVSAALTGDWLGAIDAMLPAVEVTAAALEYG